MQITPATKIVGLIGHPVAHSLSPLIHNHLYQSLGLDIVYHAFDVLPDKIDAAVNGFLALGLIGFNVTVPYKETVYQLLDYIDLEAQIIGAVNTVKVENGFLTGYNTDGQGFILHLKNLGFSLNGKNIVILGAGGAARAIGVYIAKEEPASIHIVNRTYHKAKTLAQIINNYKSREIAKASEEITPNADFIINTTTLGMWPHNRANPIHGQKLATHTVVCDIVYNPRQTAMLQYAKTQGCNTCDGFGMLIGQGLKAAEIWLGYPLPQNSCQIMSEATDMIEY
jgi:shikimate dehydrogenase